MAKSFFQATRDEIQAANRKFFAYLAANPKAIEIVELTGAQVGELLGIRLMTDDDVKAGVTPWVTYKGKQYIATKNKSNRPASVPNMRNLMKFFATGRWALNGEALIFDENGMCISAQHRTGAFYFHSLESNADASYKAPFIIVRGVPEILTDSIDTGKSRDNKDILARHQDIFRPGALRSITGYKVQGSAVNTMRKTLSKEANTCCRLLWLRTDARDVKASSTGYKQEEIFDIMSRFEPSDTLITRPEGEAFDTQLEDVLQLVYNQDVQTSGKAGTLNKYLGRADVAAALILYSNRDTEPLPANGGGRRYALPDSFKVDLPFAEAFCACATRGDGFMKPLYSHLEAEYGSKNKLEPQYYFAALVNAIQHFAKNYSSEELESAPDDNGNITKQTVYNCPPLLGHGIPRAVPKQTALERKRNPWQWPHFGGIDVGYVKPAPKKSEDIGEDDDTESDE